MVTNTVACTYSQCCYSVVINEEIAWRLVHQTIRFTSEREFKYLMVQMR